MRTDRSFLKILVISDFDGQNANVINDFLFCFNKYSRHDYYYVFDPRSINESTDFSPFDAILLFWSIYFPGATLSNIARQKIKKAQALKVLFLQDEYRDVRLFNRLMEEMGIQVMFTCVAESNHNVFYPPELLPCLQAVHTVLTGYVPAYLETSRPPEGWERPIYIQYRSRTVPFHLGDLGREKAVIAQRFQDISFEHGFRSDISVREDDRIYGKKWIEFLKTSRFTLGSPSGASVIDFTGDVRRNCETYLALNPDASYENVKQCFFADIDGKVVIDTISPRVFESAALGCVMVMHEGYYGGVLRPGRHYICVKKDYSNIDEVISQMKDNTYTRQIADYAYRDLIASGKFSYRKFARWFDEVLDSHLSSMNPRKISKFSFYATNYFKFGQAFLPKDDYFILLPGRRFWRYLKILKMLEYKVLLHVPFLGLARLLFSFFRGGLWRHTPLKSVIMDMSRLGLIYSIASSKKKISVDFAIKIVYRHNPHMLSFVSCSSHLGENHEVVKSNEFDLPQFLASLQIKDALLEWDHSPIGTHLEYQLDGKTHALDMGPDGHYQFDALTKMTQYFPDLISAILRPIIISH